MARPATMNALLARHEGYATAPTLEDRRDGGRAAPEAMSRVPEELAKPNGKVFIAP
jgi:hypothetical protein